MRTYSAEEAYEKILAAIDEWAGCTEAVICLATDSPPLIVRGSSGNTWKLTEWEKKASGVWELHYSCDVSRYFLAFKIADGSTQIIDKSLATSYEEIVKKQKAVNDAFGSPRPFEVIRVCK